MSLTGSNVLCAVSWHKLILNVVFNVVSMYLQYLGFSAVTPNFFVCSFFCVSFST